MAADPVPATKPQVKALHLQRPEVPEVAEVAEVAEVEGSICATPP